MQYKKIKEFNKVEVKEIKEILESVDKDFVPRLSKKIVFDDFISKIRECAEVLGIYDDNELVCILVMYANNFEERKAFITLLAVKQGFRGNGFGKQIIEESLKEVKKLGFKTVFVKTWGSNGKALKLYNNLGFELISQNINEFGVVEKILRMQF